jgi:hypothetical protein
MTPLPTNHCQYLSRTNLVRRRVLGLELAHPDDPVHEPRALLRNEVLKVPLRILGQQADRGGRVRGVGERAVAVK